MPETSLQLLTIMVLKQAVNVPDLLDTAVTLLLELMEIAELDRVHFET